jgi:O-antigen ligase
MGELLRGDFFDLIKLIVGVPLGIIMMIRGIKRIEELFLFLVFLVPLEIMLPTRLIPIPGMTVSNVLIIEILILLYWKKKKNDENLFFSTPMDKPFFAIVAFNGLLLLWGIVTFSSEANYNFIDTLFYYKRTILTYFLIYIISVNVLETKEDIRNAIFIMVVGVVLVGLQAVMEHSMGDPRIEGLMGQRNEEGAFFTMYFPLLLTLLFISFRKEFKILIYAATALSCYGLIFTLSRGAMIAFPMAILFLGILKYRRLLLPLCIFGAIIFYSPPKVISERFNETYEGEKASAAQFDEDIVDIEEYDELIETIDSSSFKRILIWKGALRAISESPLFGIGFNRFPYVAYEYTGVPRLRSPHNTYIEIMLNSGIIGLGLYLWLFYIVFKSAFKLVRNCNDKLYEAIGWGFMGCLIASFPVNMFGSHLFRYQLMGYFWILIGMVMRLNIMADKDKISEALPQIDE